MVPRIEALLEALAQADARGAWVGPSELGLIAEALGWQAAALWVVDRGDHYLRCTARWDASCLDPTARDQTGAGQLRQRGEGVPGAVWEHGRPLCVTDPSPADGLDAALAFPIVTAGGVVGVVELLGTGRRSVDDAVTEAVGAVGRRLARLVERQLTDERLRFDAERLEVTLAAADVGVWDWDRATDVVSWSDTMARMYNLAPDSSSAPTGAVLDRIHPDDRQRVVDALGPTVDEEHLHHLLYRVQWPDGTIRWVESRGRAVRHHDGRVLGLTGVVRDVTSRREAEEAMRRLAAIVSSSEDAIFAKDLNGIITSWNRAAERTFGYTADEVVGKHISVIVPPDREAEVETILGRISRGEHVQHFDTIRMRSDGALVHVSLSVSPVHDAAGAVAGASIIARDVTERALAEARARRAAERSARLLGMEAELAETLTLSQVIDVVVRQGTAALGAYAGVVVLTTDDGEQLQIAGARGYRSETFGAYSRFAIDSPLPLADAVRARRLVTVESDADYRARYGRQGPLLTGRTGALAAVPLVTRGHAVGALGLSFDEERVFDADDREFLLTLAGQCALALERARLFDAERAARAEAEAAHWRLAFLAEASDALAASLDYETTLTTAVRLAVPRLADWCGVSVLADDGGVRRLAVEHTDTAKRELVQRLWSMPIDASAPHGAAAVLRSGRHEITPLITDEQLAVTNEGEALDLLRELGVHSSMIVPLIARGRVLGSLTFVSGASGREYGSADLALGLELARRAAMSADNARLFTERSFVARTLQESLLPRVLPAIPGVEVGARYLAAGGSIDVGGDFYDVFDAGGGRWVVVIGDVCGKGAGAAGVTALARHTTRALATPTGAPSAVLRELNRAIADQVESDDRFFTIAYAALDPGADKTSMSLCCAGHPLPLLARADGTVVPIGIPGTLLGLFPDPELIDDETTLAPGDAVVFYTDGVTEAHGPSGEFGDRHLLATVLAAAGRSADEIAGAVADAVTTFRAGSRAPADDMAVLVVRFLGDD